MKLVCPETMNKRQIASVLLLSGALTAFALTAAQASEPAALPAVYARPVQPLVENRVRLAANPGDPRLAPALVALRVEADAMLVTPPASVTDNTLLPSSGDNHDYFSTGPYWWPDPEKPDGLPWIRRDGKTNPACRDGSDHAAFKRTCQSVLTLATAYYFTGHEPYAAHAALLARVWFLGQATRMNPNLNHAQAVPGRSQGRDVGVIEGVVLLDLTDGLALIDAVGSPAWTSDDRAAMRTWISAYLDWLLTSANGIGAGKLPNNLGTWYDAQVVQLALVLGKTDLARRTLSTAREKRLPAQILPDGRQPRELERAAPLGYSSFNLRGLLTLAQQASFLDPALGADWWERAERGEAVPRLRKALEFVSPYASSQIRWTPPAESKGAKTDNQTGARPALRELLALAASHYTDDHFRTLLSPQFSDSGYMNERWRLSVRH